MIQLKTISFSQDPKGVTLEWEDGFSKTLTVSLLRKECPCAPCQSKNSGMANKKLALPSFNPLPDAAYELVDITNVGHYAIGLKWADGHSTGIYPFDYLRKLAEG